MIHAISFAVVQSDRRATSGGRESLAAMIVLSRKSWTPKIPDPGVPLGIKNWAVSGYDEKCRKKPVG
jgi:hypothetical protein